MPDHGVNSHAAQNDPDVQNALRGIYPPTLDAWVAMLPKAWDAKTRNMVVAQEVARIKGIDTSGLDASANFSDPDSGALSWIAQHGYLVPAALTGAAALGAFGGGSGAGAGAGQSAAAAGAIDPEASAVMGLPAGGIGTAAAAPSMADLGAIAPLASTPVGTGMATLPAGVPPSAAGTAALAGASGGANPLLKAFGDAATQGKASNLAKALTALAGVGGGLAARALGPDSSDAVPSQLNDLLALSLQRAKSQQPLFDAINSGAYQMLPNFSKGK